MLIRRYMFGPINYLNLFIVRDFAQKVEALKSKRKPMRKYQLFLDLAVPGDDTSMYVVTENRDGVLKIVESGEVGSTEWNNLEFNYDIVNIREYVRSDNNVEAVPAGSHSKGTLGHEQR